MHRPENIAAAATLRGRPMVAPTGRLFCWRLRCRFCRNFGLFLCGGGFGGRFRRGRFGWGIGLARLHRCNGVGRGRGLQCGEHLAVGLPANRAGVDIAPLHADLGINMLGLLPTVLPCGGTRFLNLLAADRAGAGQHTRCAAGGCLGDNALIVGVGVL